MLYCLHVLILITVVSQDINYIFWERNVNISGGLNQNAKKEASVKDGLLNTETAKQKKENSDENIGYMPPVYMFWAVEIVYYFLACWITLSTQYWIHYPGLTKRQVLQILKMKLIPIPQNPSFVRPQYAIHPIYQRGELNNPQHNRSA